MDSITIPVMGGLVPIFQQATNNPGRASVAHNTRLWDGNIRAFREPKKITACTGQMYEPSLGDIRCVECCPLDPVAPCKPGDDNYLAVRGRIVDSTRRPVGINRPTEVPTVTVYGGTDEREHESAFRIVCTNEHGESSGPSVPVLASVPYGAQVEIRWTGCVPYRVEARLTQSLAGELKTGQAPGAWVVVREFDTPVARFKITPQEWDLTTYDGFDPEEYCDPPELDCAVKLRSGHYVGWRGQFLFVSERHDPSKWIRRLIKRLPVEILAGKAVTSTDTVYLATSGLPFVVTVAPDPNIGAVVTVTQASDNIAGGGPGSFAIVGGGAVFASPFGLGQMDRAGNVSMIGRQFFSDDQWKEWAPTCSASQRGVYFGSRPDGRWWAMDLPDQVFGATEFGRLVTIDALSCNTFSSKDGSLYFERDGNAYKWDAPGQKFMAAEWVSMPYYYAHKRSWSAARIRGENLSEGVTFEFFSADDQLVYSKVVTNDKPFRLPDRCCGQKIRIGVKLPASEKEIAVTEIKIGTSMQAIGRS